MQSNYIYKNLFIILIACSTFFAGCCNPNLQGPLAVIPKTYTKDDDNLITPEQRTALGKQLSVEWWSLFQNDSLNRTIQQAMKHNFSVIAAKKSLEQAAESVKATSGGLWPQLSLMAAAGRQKYGVALFGPVSFRIPPFTYYEVGPTASWTIDLFGKTRYSIAQQKALMQYQAHNLDAVYINLSSNVVGLALEIATVKAEIAATKKIIAEDEKILQLVKATYAAGTHSKMDILNARSQLEADRTLLPPLQQRLNIAQHALAILVGEAPANWTAPDFRLENFVLPAELPLSLPSELARKRPDILAAEDNLQAACAAVGVATANLYPSITLSADLLQESLTPYGLFLGVNNAWAMAANLTAPIFNGGTLRAQKRQAEQAYQATLAEYQETILFAFQQVADALTALSHDAKAVTLEQQAYETAAASLKLTKQRYQEGTIGLLQIQDDQRTLARAQVNLIQAQSQRYVDTVQLFVALGGSPRTIKK